MKIAIDAHAIGGRLTGNETYISNLIDHLVKADSGHEFTLIFTDPEAAATWRNKYPEIETIIARPAHPLVRIPFVMPRITRRLGADLLHVQYAGPPVSRTPLVTSIHDISYELFPEFFSRKEVLQFKTTIRQTAETAKKILTISQCSMRDLIELYGIAPEKVEVIYLGVNSSYGPLENPDSGQNTVRKYEITGAYFLAVGNLQPRKNLVRLIEAYTRLRNDQPSIAHQLVIVGKKAWRHDPILDFVRGSRWSQDIILTDYVPDEDLPVLYACAEALVYPSIYEGFGLPPLEAMACGTPVIVSDRSALPEVVGEAGIKVDPFDVDAIAASMAVVALDADLAARLREQGLKRASRFTWSACAEKTLRAYEEVNGKVAKI